MKYISLGFNCNIGLVLRNCNLKEETHVFDWILSNPKNILNIIKNNPTELLEDDIICLNFNMSTQKYLGDYPCIYNGRLRLEKKINN